MVATPAQMTPEDAAWVRQHVWTEEMRKVRADFPTFYEAPSCTPDPCWACRDGKHGTCASRPDPFLDDFLTPGYLKDTPIGFISTLGLNSDLGLGADDWEVFAVYDARAHHDTSCPCQRAGHRTADHEPDLLDMLGALP